MKRGARKGQAAIEFLSSYLWAIFGVLATISALMYFDVINPEKYFAEQCEFGANIVCGEFVLKKVDNNNYNMLVNFRNDLERAIEPVKVNIIDAKTKQEYECNEDPGFEVWCPFDTDTANWSAISTVPDLTMLGDYQWNPGTICKFKFSGCDQSVVKGLKEDINIQLTFKRKGINTQQHTIAGRIYANVQ